MKPSTGRFLSLDVFRGMTIGFMIIVNSPGSGAAPFGPLNHAAWHGFTPTDLVFPSFLFAIGNAMSFSLKKYLERGDRAVLLKILKRTLLIFTFGYLMYWFPFFRVDASGSIHAFPIGETRILGVLQRLALCYGIGALMVIYLRKKLLATVSVLILLAYWGILFWYGDQPDPLSMTGNAVLKADLWLFGPDHLWHGEGIPFDPEGLLSTLPALVNLLIGYWAGRFVQEKGKSFETVARLMLAASALLLVAWMWEPFFPFNKKLWTSSFVMLTSGLDLAILAVLVYLLELRKGKSRPGTKWNFFVIFGKNPLVIYLFSELMLVVFWTVRTGNNQNLYDLINQRVFQAVAPGPWGSLFFAVSYMLLCWVIAWVMDRKKLYVRV